MANREQIFSELREIQKTSDGYVPEAELYRLADRVGSGVCHIYSVASYYPEFRFQKPPKSEIRVCTALPCFIRGAEGVYRQIQQDAEGKSNVDVGRCPCLGRCDTAPAITINHHVHSSPDPKALLDLARQSIALAALTEKQVETTPASTAAVAPRASKNLRPAPPRWDEIGRDPSLNADYRTDPYQSIDEHYGELRRFLATGDFSPIGTGIKEGNLRGMGGAGKPFLRKFTQVKDAVSDDKYVVCNADESEPGTIKDREVLRRFPHLLVEAITLVGLAVGARKGYIYLRHEYEEQAASLRREIRWARAETVSDSQGKLVPKARYLGDNLLGSGKNFELEVFISPGGYVMGEQTALLEAIEGHRGMPRNGIFDLGEVKGLPTGEGLWGKPTIVSNVETYTYLPAILRKGGQWFKDQGVRGCEGLKWASVCGDVARPGVFEISMGTTFAEMIEKAGGAAGGRKLKAFAPSGPTFGFLPATDAFLNLPMDFPGETKDGQRNPVAAAGTSVGSGAIVVLAEGRCIVDAALNFTRFFRNESCGKCVPCRVGSQKMVDVIKQIRTGTAGEEWKDTIERLSQVLSMTSICGLGKVVHVPIQTVLKYWPDEIDAHRTGKCPAGVCATSRADREAS